MTYFYKVVRLDLDAERNRIRKVRYTPEERAKLFALCDLLEKHKVEEAIEMTRAWTTDEREFIGCAIWQFLWNITIENVLPLSRAGVVGAWIRRDVKGQES